MLKALVPPAASRALDARGFRRTLRQRRAAVGPCALRSRLTVRASGAENNGASQWAHGDNDDLKKVSERE